MHHTHNSSPSYRRNFHQPLVSRPTSALPQSPSPPAQPTNDDIEAVIQMATSARQTPDGRSGPLKDTRTQLFVGNVRYFFIFLLLSLTNLPSFLTVYAGKTSRTSSVVQALSCVQTFHSDQTIDPAAMEQCCLPLRRTLAVLLICSTATRGRPEYLRFAQTGCRQTSIVPFQLRSRTHFPLPNPSPRLPPFPSALHWPQLHILQAHLGAFVL